MTLSIGRVRIDLTGTTAMESLRSRLSRSREIAVLVRIVALIGFAYLAKKAFIDPFNGVDFKYLWTAGQVWLADHNAYGPLYSKVFAENFGYVGYPWFYPPPWFLIAVPLSMLPIIKAELLWRGVNFGLIFAALGLGFDILRRCRPRGQVLTEFMIFMAYAFFLQATSIVVSTGQTSVIPTLGLMLLAYGASYQRPTFSISGVVLLALKPQFLVAPIILLFALGVARRQIVSGMMVTSIACLPALLVGESGETVLGFLHNLQEYSAIYPNLPMFTTGLEHLIYRTTSMQLSGIGSAVLAALAAGFIGLLLRSHWHGGVKEPEDRIRALLLLFPAINFVFLPLHNYDAVLLLPVALMCLRSGFPGQSLILPSLILAFRPGNIARLSDLLGWHWDPVNLSSIAYALLATGVICFLMDILRNKSRYVSASNMFTKMAKVRSNVG